MSLQTVQRSDRHTRHTLGFNLAAISAIVLLVAVGSAYLVDELGRGARVAPPDIGAENPISQTIAGRELSIPASWFRYGEQLKPGFTSQIDLRVLFTPPGKASVPVDITLLPRSRARSSATLLDTVYLHQFAQGMIETVPGLIGKPMGKTDGYRGETVWYDALSPNPFVAKCVDPIAMGTQAQCVRTVYLASGIAATYAFDATALQSWRVFDAHMERWLSRIGAL
jgi:hypothetical protein